jgi:hypothetical protein
VKEAPPPVIGTVPSEREPSKNSRLPVKPLAPAVTLAVRTTAAPAAAGLVWDVSVVCVGA